MKLKTKVSLGVVFLFTALLTVGFFAQYYIRQLSDNARNILKDNYETLQYTKRILQVSDSLVIDSIRAVHTLEQNLVLQEENVTEPGEQQMTARLRAVFDQWKSGARTAAVLPEIRRLCLAIQEVNMQAIVRKNVQTEEASDQATRLVMIVISFVSIVCFAFIVNFPGYIANPIAQLTASIKSIANRNYEERLHFNRQDEFRELAEAFNQMAERLDEYEHSNLAQLLFEKKRIEAIISKMSDPIIGLDEKKKILFLNKEAMKIFGVSETDLIGRYAPDEALQNDLLRSLLKNLDSHEEATQPLKIFWEGKESYFMKESLRITMTPTGESKVALIGYVIMLRNVTPFKELDLAKTNFIATVSHELKTPLASIEMCSQLLADARIGAMNEEQRAIVTTINEETTRLKRITEELLNMAQVETGKMKLALEPVKPIDIITYAVKAVRFQVEQKRLAVAIECEDQLPLVKADLDKTAWVLINLLTNAIHVSYAEATVTVRATANDGRVVFLVRDDGPGIDEAIRANVFEKFSTSARSVREGTGLGLSIAKEFIIAQGGSIEVDSAPGKGTIFSFALKIA